MTTFNQDAVITPLELPTTLCVVYSKLSLNEITNILISLTEDPSSVGPSRVDFTKDGDESNRTVVLVSAKAYARAEELGWTKFQKGGPKSDRKLTIAPYFVKNAASVLPRAGQTSSLFLPIPEKLGLSAELARGYLAYLLEALADFGFFGQDEFKITIPLMSRATNQIRGYAIVSFAEDVAQESIVGAKIFLHNNMWWTATAIMKCLWAKEDKPRAQHPKKQLPDDVETVKTVQLLNRFDALEEDTC